MKDVDDEKLLGWIREKITAASNDELALSWSRVYVKLIELRMKKEKKKKVMLTDV